VHPREAARSVHSAPVHSGIGAQYLSLSAWRSTDCDRDIFASKDDHTSKAPARGPHYPTHAGSMSKILSSRSARLFLCF
jgi:hypothetical protein